MPETLLPKTRIPLRHLLVFGWLPSPLKILAYRVFLGYRIGRHVKISFGGVVIGKSVELGDHVEIGLLAVVQGETIRIGRHSSVGTMSYLSCNVIEIGEDAKIREQVYVGGPQLPESKFVLGSRTIILQLTNINPTKPVVIGDDTGIGGHCLIFTHGAWLSQLDGYPVTYEPVTLGKSVWLPWRVFIMPGTTIGDGTVIGANSLVSGNIPPSSLAVGNPAKVIRSAPDFPKKLSDAERAKLVETIIAEFDRFLEHGGVRIESQGPLRIYHYGRRSGRLLWLRGGVRVDGIAAARGDTVFSETVLAPDALADFAKHGVYWLDLVGKTRSEGGSRLTEELALFIGRYGVRLARYNVNR
jgi:acetyltransferase-like isoleucine patch superfamily enzyme